MKILAISDVHGYLPHSERFAEADILIIGGDISPIQEDDRNLSRMEAWFRVQFNPWLDSLSQITHIVGIGGNHDFVLERFGVNKGGESIDLHLTWLENSAVEIDGLKIYGIPQIPKLQGWAYYATDDQLRELYEAVPEETDIVVSHGPPVGHGIDLAQGRNRAGCPAANDMMKRVKPKAFICGHIHEGFTDARYERIYKTKCYNVSHTDEYYHPRPTTPVLIEL
jgi:Icc-related predicted phosphoesterase